MQVRRVGVGEIVGAMSRTTGYDYGDLSEMAGMDRGYLAHTKVRGDRLTAEAFVRMARAIGCSVLIVSKDDPFGRCFSIGGCGSLVPVERVDGVAQAVAHLASDAGISPGDLSEALGFCRSYLSRQNLRRRTPRLNKFADLVRIAGADLVVAIPRCGVAFVL